MKLLFIWLCLASCFVSCSTRRLNGYYIVRGANGSRILEFNDGSFMYKDIDHGYRKFGEGSFRVTSKKLTLKYKYLENKDTATYKIEYGPEYTKTAIVKIKTVHTDSTGTTMQPIRVLDKKGREISSFKSTFKGIAEIYLPNHSQIGYLSIGHRYGYGEVQIPFAKSKGKVCFVTVYMKHQWNTYIDPGKRAYLIEKINDKQLILRTEGGTIDTYNRNSPTE